MGFLMMELLSNLNKSLSTAVPKLAHLGYQRGVVKNGCFTVRLSVRVDWTVLGCTETDIKLVRFYLFLLSFY